MESILQHRFLDLVPVRLTAIRDALNAMKPRLVRVNKVAYINPCEISSVCEYREDIGDNSEGGRVNVTMRNDMTFATFFKTAPEAFKALGMTADPA